jgi:hypothetical protein
MKTKLTTTVSFRVADYRERLAAIGYFALNYQNKEILIQVSFGHKVKIVIDGDFFREVQESVKNLHFIGIELKHISYELENNPVSDEPKKLSD